MLSYSTSSLSCWSRLVIVLASLCSTPPGNKELKNVASGSHGITQRYLGTWFLASLKAPLSISHSKVRPSTAMKSSSGELPHMGYLRRTLSFAFSLKPLEYRRRESCRNVKNENCCKWRVQEDNAHCTKAMRCKPRIKI
jgi:hypothetical protein